MHSVTGFIADLEKLSLQLKRVHRLFLDSEKLDIETKLGQKLAPLDFFNRLTQDPSLAWMKSLSSLIAELDEFVDHTKKPKKHLDGTIDPIRVPTLEDVDRFRSRIEFVLLNPASKLAFHYKIHLAENPDLVMAHAELRSLLGPPPNDD